MFLVTLALATTSLAPLRAKLDAVCAGFHGRIGYDLKLLKSGQEIGSRQDERFPTASTIKTGLMTAVVQEIDEGKLKWTDEHPLPDPNNREASMWSYYLKEGTKLDVDGWVNLMIMFSDNTATICLRDWLGTMEINRRLEALGLKETKILGNAPASEAGIQRLHTMFGMGMTTPKEMNRLFELIYKGKAASSAGCDKMLRILSHDYWDDWLGTTVPPSVRLANKVGAITRSRSEAAIVFCSNPYILTIYTDNQKDQRWVAGNEGEATITKIGTLVWAFLNPNQPYALPPGYREKFMPTGGGVE